MIDSCLKSFSFEQTTWLESGDEILSVRNKVFVIEQHYEKAEPFNQQDFDAFHLIVRNSDFEVVACGRITPTGRIGKIAVTLPYRGLGIGSKLLKMLIQHGQENNINDLYLNAEIENQNFYQLQEFFSAGPVFMKHGIPHRRLARKLAQ